MRGVLRIWGLGWYIACYGIARYGQQSSLGFLFRRLRACLRYGTVRYCTVLELVSFGCRWVDRLDGVGEEGCCLPLFFFFFFLFFLLVEWCGR